MAQQFKQLFGLGIENDESSISTIDPSGIALIAIQELKKQNDALTATVQAQQNLIDELLSRVNELKALMHVNGKQ
jgi:FtsZ-binding cell division protein ZapB